MKFPKNKTYDALFLSDIHYLLNKKVKNHFHRELIGMLYHLRKRGIRFRKIFLVGDIIENWFFDASVRIRRDKKVRKRFNKLFDRLDKIAAKGAEKVYIVGNHDTTSFTMALDFELERYLKKRRYDVCEVYEDDELVVLHGHQGQYNKITWMLNILGLRILHILALFIPRFFHVMEAFYDEHLNRMDPATPDEKLRHYERLSRLSKQGHRVLVSGHTHDFLCMEEVRIVNTGDWVKSKTFIVKDGRQWLGVHLRGKKDYELVFSEKL